MKTGHKRYTHIEEEEDHGRREREEKSQETRQRDAVMGISFLPLSVTGKKKHVGVLWQSFLLSLSPFGPSVPERTSFLSLAVSISNAHTHVVVTFSPLGIGTSQ